MTTNCYPVKPTHVSIIWNFVQYSYQQFSPVFVKALVHTSNTLRGILARQKLTLCGIRRKNDQYTSVFKWHLVDIKSGFSRDL